MKRWKVLASEHCPMQAACAEVGTNDVEAALAEYSRRWLPSALAVVELTEEGFGGNRRAFTLNFKLVQVRCRG